MSVPARTLPARRGTARFGVRHGAALRRAGRLGYVAYGAIHLLVGWLAVQIAFGRSDTSADAGGALETLARAPFGRALLAVLAVGLVLLTAWTAARAAWDTTDDGKQRVVAAGQAVCFAALAVGAGRTVLSDHASSSGHAQQAATATVLGLPGGRYLVGAAGVALGCLGVGLVVHGLLRRFRRTLDLGRLGHRARRAVLGAGTVGYVAKGVAYALVGGLLVTAAVTLDPHRGRGLDQALRTVAGQPHGRVLLCAIAAGLGCFAALCVVRARYERR